MTTARDILEDVIGIRIEDNDISILEECWGKKPFMVFCDASSGYYVSVDIGEGTEEDCLRELDFIASNCWPGEGEWPRDSNEYDAFVVRPCGEIERITGRGANWFYWK